MKRLQESTSSVATIPKQHSFMANGIWHVIFKMDENHILILHSCNTIHISTIFDFTHMVCQFTSFFHLHTVYVRPLLFISVNEMLTGHIYMHGRFDILPLEIIEVEVIDTINPSYMQMLLTDLQIINNIKISCYIIVLLS